MRVVCYHAAVPPFYLPRPASVLRLLSDLPRPRWARGDHFCAVAEMETDDSGTGPCVCRVGASHDWWIADDGAKIYPERLRLWIYVPYRTSDDIAARCSYGFVMNCARDKL